MIGIKIRKETWNLEIRDEEWEFNTREEMQKVLDYFLDLKNKRGRLKNYEQ